MARLDTGWCVNQKVLALRVEGIALHAWSISYCDLTRSDGYIRRGSWPTLPWVRAGIRALIAAGMWEPAEDGFWLHDYRKYNRSREQIEAEQQAAAERQSRHRSRVTTGVTHAVTENSESRRDTRARGQPGPIPGPVGSVDLLKNGSTPLAGGASDAQGPTGTASAPLPKWEEIAPGQYRGSPNGAGEVSLLKARCPRCERTLPVAEIDGHDCQLVPGVPVENPQRHQQRRSEQSPTPQPVNAHALPSEVQEQLNRMEAEARRTPEQVATVLRRLGRD